MHEAPGAWGTPPGLLEGRPLRLALDASARLLREEGARADLHGADLRGADLHGANLRGAKLRGTKLRGADLAGVRNKGLALGLPAEPI